jgi:signal peptidase
VIRRITRILSLAAVAAVLAAWALTLRPEQLGGPALYVVIRGGSMLPLYENGDLVVTLSSPGYVVGDVVAYRVPAGEIGAGHVVIHRIVGRDDVGGYVVKGDNNSFADPWAPQAADVAGKAWLAMPGLGRVIAFVQQPVIAAGLAMSVAITIMLARPPPRARRLPGWA